jgi:O-antigen/teichoic acid export membrane protein
MAGFSRDVLRTLVTQAAVIGLGVAGGALTARVLGPADRGIFSLCTAIATTAALFASLEVGQSLVYHVARGRVALAAILGAVPALMLGIGALTALGLGAAWPLFRDAYASVSLEPFVLAVVLIPFTMASDALRQTFRAVDQMDAFNLQRMLQPALRLACLLAAFAGGGRLLASLVALLVAEVLGLGVALLALLRQARPDFRAARAAALDLLRFGARVEVSSALGYATGRLGVFVIAYHLSPEDIAFYAIAESLAQQLFTVPQVIGTVLLPKVAVGSAQDASELTAAAHRSTLLITLALVLAIALVAHPLIVVLYGRDFAAAFVPLLALLPGAVFRAGARVISPYMISSDRVGAWTAVLGGSLLVYALLLALWVPRFGTAGAGAASSVAFLVQWLLAVAGVRGPSGLRLREWVLVSPRDVARVVEVARAEIARALR